MLHSLLLMVFFDSLFIHCTSMTILLDIRYVLLVTVLFVDLRLLTILILPVASFIHLMARACYLFAIVLLYVMVFDGIR